MVSSLEALNDVADRCVRILAHRECDRPRYAAQHSHTHGTDMGDHLKRSSKKRRRHSSSDSSLLEIAQKAVPPPQIPESTEHQSARTRQASPVPQKKRKVASSQAESPEQPETRHETFEKRSRHKTREDRYESKSEKTKARDKAEKEIHAKRKREKKGDRKKAAKKAGEALMQNFSSKAIGQERLTVRIPSHAIVEHS